MTNNKPMRLAALLGSTATLQSGETGTIIGFAMYTDTTPHYYLRYKAADGRLVENWWAENAFNPLPDKGVA